MKTSDKKLIQKYLNKSISNSEKEIFNKKFSESIEFADAVRNYTEKFQNYNLISGLVDTKSIKKKNIKLLQFLRLSIAAVFILSLGISVFFVNKSRQNQQQISNSQKTIDSLTENNNFLLAKNKNYYKQNKEIKDSLIDLIGENIFLRNNESDLIFAWYDSNYPQINPFEIEIAGGEARSINGFELTEPKMVDTVNYTNTLFFKWEAESEGNVTIKLYDGKKGYIKPVYEKTVEANKGKIIFPIKSILPPFYYWQISYNGKEIIGKIIFSE